MGIATWLIVGLVVVGPGLALIAWALAWGDRSRGRLRCPRCWYRMEGIDGLRCPECGRVASSDHQLRRTRRRWRASLLGLCVVLLGIGVAGGLLSRQDLWLRATPTWLLMLMVDVPDYTRANQIAAAAPPPKPAPNATGAMLALMEAQGLVGPSGNPPPTPSAWAMPPPPPPMPPPAKSIGVALATELARRHNAGTLTPEQRARLARRTFPDFHALESRDFLAYKDKAIHAWPITINIRPGALASRAPMGSPIHLRIAIVKDGRNIWAGDVPDPSEPLGYRFPGNRVLPGNQSLGFLAEEGAGYTLALTLTDQHGGLATRTFPLDISVRAPVATLQDRSDQAEQEGP